MSEQITIGTHTVYPEIISDIESGQWLGRLITREGKIVQEFTGTVDPAVSGMISDVIKCRKEITNAAYKQFNKVIKQYARSRK